MLATKALTLERVVHIETCQSSKLRLSRSVVVLIALSHLVLHTLREHARHSAAAEAGADVRAHSATTTQASEVGRLHVSERIAQHTSAERVGQANILATRSSKTRLAGRPSRWTTKLTKTSQTSEATVRSNTAGLTTIIACRALTANMTTEVGKRTKTTKASTLVHSVTTESEAWERRVRNVRGVVKRLTELFATVLLRRFVRVRIGRTLRVITRASRSLLVVGLQEARSKSASIVRGHAKCSKSKVAIASVRTAGSVEATDSLVSVGRREVGASCQRGTSRDSIVLVRFFHKSSRVLGPPRFVLVNLGQVRDASLVLQGLGTNVFVAILGQQILEPALCSPTTEASSFLTRRTLTGSTKTKVPERAHWRESSTLRSICPR
jgi:hypothetical protein